MSANKKNGDLIIQSPTKKQRLFKAAIRVNIILISFLLSTGCKKEPEIISEIKVTGISAHRWEKTSTFILQHEVYDTKLLSNGNIGLLTDNYYVFDSLFQVLSTFNLNQSLIPSFHAKRLSMPFLTNQKSADYRSFYQIQNHFNINDGKITTQLVVDKKAFFDISDLGYTILLDDKLDRIHNKSIRLFRKTDLDTTDDELRNVNVFTDKEPYSRSGNFFEKIIETSYAKIACTKTNYLLYGNDYSGLKFFDASLIITDTNILNSTVIAVFSNENAFYIFNNYGLFMTEDGKRFSNISRTFNPKCFLTNELMFGINNNKPCILNITDNTLSYLPIEDFPDKYYEAHHAAIGYKNNIVFFTQEGVYQIKYR